MQSLGKITEELINRSPFLREAMAENLINISSLARKLKPEIEEIFKKEVNEGAIVMAIKRMPPGYYHQLELKIKNVMGEIGDLLVRSNLADFTFKNSETLKEQQSKLMNLLNKETDSFFTICHGITETTFIVSSNHIEVINELFKEEKLTSHSKNLASVSVKLPPINSELHGIYYYLLKHLAWEGINIIEIVSTSNEFTCVVSQVDIDRAFTILMKLKRDNSL
ncbi:MAG: aspartate kinase [Flavobacteriia bacterium]|nr:aspartate kinase [Flavobacteriia bacterium]